MTVGLTTTQWTNTREASTRPIRVIRWEHAGYLELISESGAIEFNGELFGAGGVASITVDDGQRATITVSASTARIAESINGRWRNGKICQIYTVPGLPSDDDVYTLAEGVLVLDGIIDSSDYSSGVVSVSVVHKDLFGNLTPRQTFNAYSEYLPNSGAIVEWEGEKYLLKSKR
jgi:hypothetical protein